MTEFWNSDITDASWNGLQDLRREVEFLLIGGWATYLYTKLQKSKDIDIVVDYDALRILESTHRLDKNERLQKYEIKFDRYDIDIYLPNYSRLAIPPKDLISKFASKVEGFSLPVAEALMVLKLGAAEDRGNSAKGMKDSIDVLGLLFYANMDMQVFKKILSDYGLTRYAGFLMRVLNGFDKRDLHYLNLNENSFSKLRHKYIEEIKKIL